jgi:hypothetical protein
MNENFLITIFDSKHDKNTSKTISKRNWKQFSIFIENLSKLEFTKQTAPLISPAVYKEDTTRLNSNVLAWGHWAAIDVDSHPFKNTTEIYDYLEQTQPGQAYICYSTASSTQEKPKFRLIFPLTGWLHSVDKIRRFWYSLNKELNEIVDKQTKDVSRMFYIPAQYKESTNTFFWKCDGNFLNPDELIKKHKADEIFILNTQNTSFLDMLPDKMKDSVLNYRKQQLNCNGKIYNWTSWKDCPFVNKNAVDDYRNIALLKADGRYRGLYQLMVSIAGIAVQKQYPISPEEIKQLILEIDDSIDGYYRKKNRKLDPEINRAISWVYSNNMV